MYDRILIPTDGSEQSSNVLDHAVELAAKLDAELAGIYVVDRGGIQTTQADMRESIIEEFQETGEGALEEIRSRAEDAGLDVTTELVSGNPSEKIMEYAEENDVDLIVMGTHGRTGLSHVLMGSVAEKVVRHADVPVHLIRYSE